MGILDDILAQKADEIAAMRSSATPARPSDLAVRDVARALQRAPGTALRLIAEIRDRSNDHLRDPRLIEPRCQSPDTRRRIRVDDSGGIDHIPPPVLGVPIRGEDGRGEDEEERDNAAHAAEHNGKTWDPLRR